jgi:hypothetical protein
VPHGQEKEAKSTYEKAAVGERLTGGRTLSK